MVYINGILATEEDRELLNYNIIHNNLQFTATRDENGVQYVTTFD